LLLYNTLTFNVDPFWRQVYSVQNVMPSAPPWTLPLEYGALVVLAPLGVWAARRRLTLGQQIALAWLVAGLALMYLPVPYQRRFASALWPPLAVFALLGWPRAQQALATAFRRLRLPSGAAQRTCGAAVATAFLTPLVIWLVVLASAAWNTPSAIYTVDRDSYELGQWIATASGLEDVVLASFDTGNVYAGFLLGRVVAGHDAVTYDAIGKKAALAALYRGQLSDADARAFLTANRVSYLVVGSGERALGSYDPGLALGLPVANRIGSAVAYRVAQL
jgi:hypothetical protein